MPYESQLHLAHDVHGPDTLGPSGRRPSADVNSLHDNCDTRRLEYRVP